MNLKIATGLALIAVASANPAFAQSADAGAGAEIIAPLEISNTADLYFGTIAPSTTVDDVVSVSADGSRKCGPALVCLTADHTPAAFAVTGQDGASYTISLPGEIEITSANGDRMKVSEFTGSKATGQLLNGLDDFTVGGTLAVAARQAAGKYRGAFTVTVEYK
jgi:hypothetical protein